MGLETKGASNEKRSDSRKNIVVSDRPATLLALTTRRKRFCGSCRTPKKTPTSNSLKALLYGREHQVSGLYFAHPEAKYFRVGKINRDLVLDCQVRKGCR